MAQTHDITIPDTLQGTRLDQALAQMLPDLSRSRLKNLILDGQVSDGDITLAKPNHKVSAGDVLSVDIPPAEEAEPKPEHIPLDILFEDEHLIVINKPSGLVVHPAPGHWSGTLVNALLHHCGDTLSGINGVRRPGIVHRLDKDTTGVMVVAKSDLAHQHLAEQFADHGRTGALERIYTALAWGQPPRNILRLETPIGRDPGNRLRMKVVAQGRGRNAITHAELIGVFGDDKAQISHIACRLETGRTHQIRVHLANIGHPLLGDDVYGAGFKSKARLLPPQAQNALEILNRQALHASVLAFTHPVSDEVMRFETKLPDDFANLLTALAL